MLFLLCCAYVFLLQTILKLEKNLYGIQPEEKKGESALTKLFHVFREKLLKLISSTDYTDGIEIVAMLVTVHMLLSQRHSLPSSSEKEKEYLLIYSISTEELNVDWDYMEEVLLECKRVLTDRLDEYVASQLAWFRDKKIDPKKTGVFSPIARFPAFIDQIMAFGGVKVSCESP